MEILYENILQLDIRYVIMWIIGGILIYLAIKKDMEPTLLLPIGFGTILVNLPNSGAIDQLIETYHPDRILVEPTGVGKLSEILAAVEKAKERHDDIDVSGSATVVEHCPTQEMS